MCQVVFLIVNLAGIETSHEYILCTWIFHSEFSYCLYTHDVYLQVKEIEKRDSVLTPTQQIDRLLRPGSMYSNLNPFEVRCTNCPS